MVDSSRPCSSIHFLFLQNFTIITVSKFLVYYFFFQDLDYLSDTWRQLLLLFLQ